tara:strand:+ start:455 stop:1120 length:666 start_codon:yes stop_codon:yes gene_type:complete
MKIGRFIKKFWNTLESYDVLTKIIFKNKIHYKLWDGTWDLTSLVLKKTIDSDFDRNYKNYLDIGCGHVALFGQYIKKKYPKTHVVSSDKYSNVINCAKKNILKNKHKIDLIESNLFSNILGKFDLITANLPYVPKKIKHGIKKGSVRYNSRYSGNDGTELSWLFLKQVGRFLKPNGKVYFGVNCYYIKEENCMQLIKKNNFKIKKIIKKKFNSARVFIIEK